MAKIKIEGLEELEKKLKKEQSRKRLCSKMDIKNPAAAV